jgi:hypothetical protein
LKNKNKIIKNLLKKYCPKFYKINALKIYIIYFFLYNIYMTETENKYLKSKIYKITNTETNNFYIGSTYKDLNFRLTKHKGKYRAYKKGKENHVSVFKLFDSGIDKCIIELIEDFPCETRKELCKREGEHIKNNNCDNCINKNIAGRTQKEYQKDNKETLNKYWKEYRIKNREKVNNYMYKYINNNRDKFNEYQRNYYYKNKDKIKDNINKYIQNNKEKIYNQKKEYYQLNKEKIKQKYKDKKNNIDKNLFVIE